MAILLALFSSALWGSADFEGGRISKRYSPFAVTGLSQAIGLLCGVILVLATGAWREKAMGPDGYLFPSAMAGILGYLGLICLYTGLATGKMGVVSPISSLSAIIPVTIAVAGGEKLSTLALLGITIALIGAFCTSGPEFTQGLPFRPILLAVSSALCFGFALTFMTRGSAVSALMTMATMRATTFLISCCLALKYRTLGGIARSDMKSIIYIGVADFSANLALGVASTLGLISIVVVLGTLFPIATALLAFWILHERLHRVQYVGMALALVGIAIISAL